MPTNQWWQRRGLGLTNLSSLSRLLILVELSARRATLRTFGRNKMKLHIIKNPHTNPEAKRLLITEGLIRAPFDTIENLNLPEAYEDGCHVVMCGYIALTHLSHFFEEALKMKQPEQDRVLRPILGGGDTVTLFPPNRVTILPYRYDDANYQSGAEPTSAAKDRFSIEEVERHIRSAFEIERSTIKAGKIVFCFLDLHAGMLRYRNLVHSLLGKDYAEKDLECFMWSYDNSEFTT